MTGSEEEFILKNFRYQSCAKAAMDGEKEAGAKHFVALNTHQRPLYRPLCGPWHCALWQLSLLLLSPHIHTSNNGFQRHPNSAHELFARTQHLDLPSHH
jgi:hypothetical protein